MANPTQQILQRGTYANDGTGDTLRDAAQKINDNFTYLWNDVYAGASTAPGRKFLLGGKTGADPDSGEFTLLRGSLSTDSEQAIRISKWDQEEVSFKTSLNDSAQGFQLSLWSLDSGSTDDWNLMARFEGNLFYESTDDYWRFNRTSTIVGTEDSSNIGGTYYIKIDGVW